ncbi:MAG: thioredoxin [Anaerolineales bacterium]|nr:thioredoxin [Anaerolineales bacterium]MCW5854469.1 thioredoxin [Anaerolineales bacterium]
MSKLHPVTSDTFDSDVLQANQPVLLEFGAEWCQPCRVLEPLLEQLAEDWEGHFTFAKLDVDQATEITARYGVLSVPTTILFKDGQEVERIVGLQPKQKLWEKLAAHQQ